MVKTVKQKVYAYITQGGRLLVFRHIDFPEAGTQVPGGTVKEGEDLRVAVLREAGEETGLENLVLRRFLGTTRRDFSDAGQDIVHLRYFYHLEATSAILETWQHYETDPSEGGTEPIRFEFYWVPISDGMAELGGENGLGDLLPQFMAMEGGQDET